MRTIRKVRRAARRSSKDYSNWAGPKAATYRKQAEELVALAPDVIVSSGSFSTGTLLQVTHTVPVVFTIVPDPVGSGFVDSLAQPGGNATGFMQFEYGLSGKWLELLKKIAPGVTRALVLRDAAITAGIGQFAIIQSVATSAGVDVRPVNLRDADEIERAITAFARSPNGGLIVTASASSAIHRDLIIALAARHKLPAVTSNVFSSPPAAWSPMEPILMTSFGGRLAMSIASSRARSPLIFPCKLRLNTS